MLLLLLIKHFWNPQCLRSWKMKKSVHYPSSPNSNAPEAVPSSWEVSMLYLPAANDALQSSPTPLCMLSFTTDWSQFMERSILCYLYTMLYTKEQHIKTPMNKVLHEIRARYFNLFELCYIYLGLLIGWVLWKVTHYFKVMYVLVNIRGFCTTNNERVIFILFWFFSSVCIIKKASRQVVVVVYAEIKSQH